MIGHALAATTTITSASASASSSPTTSTPSRGFGCRVGAPASFAVLALPGALAHWLAPSGLAGVHPVRQVLELGGLPRLRGALLGRVAGAHLYQGLRGALLARHIQEDLHDLLEVQGGGPSSAPLGGGVEKVLQRLLQDSHLVFV